MKERKPRRERLAGPYVSCDLASRVRATCAVCGMAESELIERSLEAHLAGLGGTAALEKRLERVEQSVMRVRQAVDVYGEGFFLWATTSSMDTREPPQVAGRQIEAFLRRLAAHLRARRSFLADLLHLEPAARARGDAGAASSPDQ